jgi:hypothetical protein
MRWRSARVLALLAAAAMLAAPAAAQLMDPTGGVAPYPGFQKVGTLRMATINTFLRDGPVRHHDGGCRGRAIGEFVRGSGADLVAFQELFDDDYWAELKHAMGGSGWYTGIAGYPRVCLFEVWLDLIRGRPYDPDDPAHLGCVAGNGGLGLAARRGTDNYPTLVKHVWYADGLTTDFTRQFGELLTSWDTWKRKGFVHVTVPKAGTTFHFLVTHTNAGNDSRDVIAARDRDLDALLDYVEAAVPEGQPFIVLGDLNVDDTDTRESNPHVSHPPNDRDQRGRLRREIERRFGPASADPLMSDLSVFGRYHGHATGQHLTYDRAANFFGRRNTLPSPWTVDWDDTDFAARFDWMLYHGHGSNLYLAPVSAGDVRIERMEVPLDAGCETRALQPIPQFLGITNGSDHFALLASLEIWSSPLPPPPSGPPFPPPPPEPGRSLSGRDGVVATPAGELENYNGRYPVHARPALQHRGGPPDVIRVQEQRFSNGNWGNTRYWDLQTAALYDTLVTVEVAQVQSAAPQRFRYFAYAHNPTGWSNPGAASFEVLVKYTSAVAATPELAGATISGGGTCRVEAALEWAQPANGPAGAFLVAAGSEGAANAEMVQAGPGQRFEDLELCAGRREYAVRACQWDPDRRRAFNCGLPARVDVDPEVKQVSGAPPCAHTLEHSGGVTGDGRYFVRWSEVDGADTYVIEQARDATFADAVEAWRGAETSATLSVAPDSGRYFVRLKACRAGACHCGYRTSYVPVDSRPDSLAN